MIRIIEISEAYTLLKRRTVRLAQAGKVVGPIIDAVRKRGDAALYQYAKKLDNLGSQSLFVTGEMEAAWQELPKAFVAALKTASANIRRFAREQLPKERFFSGGPGVKLGQVVRPLQSMAAYVPAGRYPLPSTLLMTVIPAQVAGVPYISVACPRPSPEILGAARFLDLHAGTAKFFRMGGAHAIAAFAFGTASVPRVERIVGPGNIYTTAAKKLLAGEVGIDFIAGPTEILIIAPDSGDPRHIAADMLAQAEHDVDAAAIVLTKSAKLAKAIAAEVEKQLATLPTAKTARPAIARNSAVIVVRSDEDSISYANQYAAEHLSIPDMKMLPEIRNAGSVFVGPYSTEAAGDYASGPNHVLPTSGVARLRGGLSAADFVKVISVQELSCPALKKLEPAITTLARAEGLEAHARSVEVRTRG